MIYYYQNDIPFIEFANKLSSNGVESSIIIMDPALYNSSFELEPKFATVKNTHQMEHVNVILIEKLSELTDLLEQTIRGKSGPLFSSSIVGIFDIFSGFLSFGTAIETSYFLDYKDYSAKTLNYICNLLYNVSYYRGVNIYISDRGNELITLDEPTLISRHPLIWNSKLPSTNTTSLQKENDIDNELKKSVVEVPLEFVLSKWISEVTYLQ
ncbi:hypothetical protein CLIB1423_12S00826 [[Candida] railenensis]|uniref:Uncharacterized protein n=1 Tax=[Candida] railenensis TaxID=45579 RepID=A0A9P0QQK6_9ASCO|nr:hypothetical protein CLIB1423_12S00826 [[Candida] railenensis]